MDDADAPFVRPATLADVPRAEEILHECLHAYGIDPDFDEHAFYLHPSMVERVAQIDEEIVGFASMRPDGDREGWISKLFVDAEYRRLGVARILLDDLEEEARMRGWRRLGLSTRNVFREAIALYESRGWIRGPAPMHHARRDRTYFFLL
jgi:GNAT superfamily N-acetyltransferase